MTLFDILGVPFKSFPVIDSHAHMDHQAQFYCPGDPGIDGMIAAMDRVGIDRVFIAPNMAINCDILEGNERVRRAAEKYPERVVALCTVNLNRMDDTRRTLEKCFRSPVFKGIKFHPDFMRYSVQDEDKMNEILDCAKANSACVISHTDARLYPGHLTLYSHPAYFEPYIRRYPDVNFALAHCGLVPEGYDVSIRLAQQYENVFLDTTGFRFSNRWTVEDIARKVGPHKLVFGTDMPFNDLSSALSRVLFADLPLNDRISILGKNAMHMIGET